jgi:fatty acid/phospholipid biosynthesis enzyme
MVGLSGIVVKSHGGADSIAFARAIALATLAARRGLTAHIAQAPEKAPQATFPLDQGN